MNGTQVGLILGGVALVALGLVILLDVMKATTRLAELWVSIFGWMPGVRRGGVRWMRVRWRVTGAGWLFVGVMLVLLARR
jgi:hypothetical protein